MCTGFEIAALIGGGISAAGGLIQQQQANKQAQAKADARNNELKRTLARNDPLADKSRQQFTDRLQQITPDAVEQDQQKAADTRAQDAASAIDAIPSVGEAVPLAGSTPDVVKSDLAKRIGEAMQGSKEQAGRQAQLSGFGDSWLNQGIKDGAVGRDLQMNSNFAGGNMALLPYAQDFAEQRATRPMSPIGGILQGLGSMMSSYGGGGGAVPKKRYTSPYQVPRAPGLY